ncbi:hypothetical protein B0H19DRAFT_1178144 [Mycena capillaripes]|nr:hypothetical protein B0H19DRAFT_1178144 [Mycena capillaripes]
MTLTSDALPALPKLDKNHFITSYLQGQRAHAKSHAEEGRSLSSSWDANPTPRKPSAAATGSNNVGFATPILVARIPRPADEECSKKETKMTVTVEKKTQPKAKPNDNNPQKAFKPQKSLSKKRGADPQSDEDQAARLSERRERKRIKRAIVQPKEASEPDTVSSDGNDKQKKRTKAKGKKPKVPPGFALMHGFTATNVGKNRLTLKPPSNVGVFKKGKASFNAKINPKSKVHKTQHFSEFRFLNNTRKAPEKSVSEPSSADSDSTAPSVKEVLKTKQKVKSGQAKSRSVTQQASEVSRHSASEQPPRVESEIWDMESRASEKRKLIKEKTGSVDEASAIDNQGTVVVDAWVQAWSDRVAKATGMDPAKRTVEHVPDPIPSSPSLRPSQSASQVGQLLIKPNPPEAASRYFPATRHKQSTSPPEPDSNASKPFTSLSRDPEPMENHQDVERDKIFPVSDAPVPPVRFVVPTRNRVFARQFLSVQAVRLQSQDSCIYPSAVVGPQVAYEGWEDLHQCAPGTSPEIPESGYDFDDEPAERYYVTEEPLYCDTQLGHPQSGEGWDANAANPVLDGSWADVLDDEGPDEFAIEYGTTFEPDCMDTADGDGYMAPGYAESDSGALYVHCDTLFGGIEDEVDAPVSNEGFDTWKEVTANSLYLAEGSVTFDDPNNYMDDAPKGQEFLGFPTQASAVAGDSNDIMSDCSDSVYTPRFAQGRALLLGLPLHESTGRISAPPHFSSAEVDVVKALRGHWLPQRL